MRRVRETKDSSGAARRGRQQEGEAHHKAMRYPHTGRHRYPTAVGSPQTDQNSELIRRVPCLIIIEPGQDDDADRSRYFTPRPLLLVAGSGLSSNLEALHTKCFRKGDCVRVVLGTRHYLARIPTNPHMGGVCTAAWASQRSSSTRKSSSQCHHHEQKHRSNVPSAVPAIAVDMKALSMFSRISFVFMTWVQTREGECLTRLRRT
jgi:hypothetical protein